MAGKYSFAEKTRRTLTLLMGLHHPQVQELLGVRGLDASVLEEGQELLLEAIKLHTSTVRAPTEEFDPHAEPRAFRTQWFEVCKARLKRHSPRMAELLSTTLKRHRGMAPYAQVTGFLQQLDAMQEGDGVYEADGPAARELLRQLGLTDGVIEELRANMSLMTETDPSALTPLPDRAARARAEDAMWAWYIEWSTIARKLVTNATLRRALGLGKQPKARTSRAARSAAQQSGEQAAR